MRGALTSIPDEDSARDPDFSLVSFSLSVYVLRRFVKMNGYKLAVTNMERIYRQRGIQKCSSLFWGLAEER